MKTITIHPSPYSAFSIPFIGIHPEFNLFVRSDGFIWLKDGTWSPGYDHRAKHSKLTYKRCDVCSRPRKRRMVHVLVAETFLRNPDNKPTVDHKDRNTLNNDVFNLRFATYAEQSLNTKAHLYKPDEGTLKAIQKERSRQYYLEHKDLIKKRSREWYLTHAEQAKARGRERHRLKKLASMSPVVGAPTQEADDTHNDKKE